MLHHYVASFGPLHDVAQLAAAWRALEQDSRCSFFQTWAWIGNWLQLVSGHRTLRLLTVHHGANVVALGIFSQHRRFYGLGPMNLRLHEVGSRDLDNITIEYNGLVTTSGHERDALTAAVHHLAQHEPAWLTLSLPGLDASAVDFDALQSDALDMRLRLRSTPYVDLAALRASGIDYRASLAPRMRTTLRRTERRLADMDGTLQWTEAEGAESALAFFRSLREFHQRHWSGEDGRGGAFADPRVVRFHERLIAQADAHQGARLTRLSAGTQVVGYLYHFVWHGTLYYYQSGIDYARFGDAGSPGLLLIAQAAQRALDAGMARYEFMAGDSDYKRRMASTEGRMAWVSIDRIGLASRARHLWWSLTRKPAA